MAKNFSRKIWVKKDAAAYGHSHVKEIFDQRFLDRRCSYYVTEDSGDVKSGGKRFKELRPGLGSCAHF